MRKINCTLSSNLLENRKEAIAYNGFITLFFTVENMSYILPPSANKCTFGHVLNQTLLTLTNSLENSSNIYDTKLISLDSS